MAKNYPSVAFKAFAATVGALILLIIIGLLFKIEWFFAPLFSIAGFIVLFLFIFAVIAAD